MQRRNTIMYSMKVDTVRTHATAVDTMRNLSPSQVCNAAAMAFQDSILLLMPLVS